MRLACAVLTLAVAVLIPAMEVSAADFAVGARGGMAVSSIYGDYGEDYDSKIGVLAGGFATIYFSEYLGFQAELLYVMKGAGFKIYYYDEYYEYYDYFDAQISLDYFEVPLLVKVRVPISEGVSPNFFFGPAIGINTSATGEVDYSGIPEFDIDGISTLDVSVVAGLGIDIAFEPLFFTCDARYEMGLSNINDADYWASQGYDVASEKNHAMMFTIGFGVSL